MFIMLYITFLTLVYLIAGNLYLSTAVVLFSLPLPPTSGEHKSEDFGLKLNVQKTKIMVSGPITSWHRWGNSGNMKDFILGGSKITADDDYSHEIKRYLLLGRKAMTNLGILKSRDITLPTKV